MKELHPEKFLTKPEVADLMVVTERSIDSYMRRGILPYYKIGRTVRFRLSDIEKHLSEKFRINGK